MTSHQIDEMFRCFESWLADPCKEKIREKYRFAWGIKIYELLSGNGEESSLIHRCPGLVAENSQTSVQMQFVLYHEEVKMIEYQFDFDSADAFFEFKLRDRLFGRVWPRSSRSSSRSNWQVMTLSQSRLILDRLPGSNKVEDILRDVEEVSSAPWNGLIVFWSKLRLEDTLKEFLSGFSGMEKRYFIIGRFDDEKHTQKTKTKTKMKMCDISE